MNHTYSQMFTIVSIVILKHETPVIVNNHSVCKY